VRADLKLEIELAPRPPVTAPALAPRVSGALHPTSALSVPAIEDDFDVSIVPKPFDQILIEVSIVARDEEQVSSDGALGPPSDMRSRACVAH
jgi:hypothetical protein